MSGIWRDVGFGLRLLRKSPGFTLVAILTLALGIGGNTAIFSAVYATLLEPAPYPHPEQLVVVWSRLNGNRNVVSAGDFLDWKRMNSSFAEIDAGTGVNLNISTSSEPENIVGTRVSPGWISHGLEAPLELGRDFLPEEGQLGRDHEVILNHRFWQMHFASDPNIVGQPMRIDNEPYTVVGVLPAGVYDRYPFQLWLPLAFRQEQLNHDFRWLTVEARLKPGVTIAQAQADMNGVTQQIAEVYPRSNKSWGASIEPLQNDFLSQNTRGALYLLAGAVGFVLLIACANVANLLLARGLARQKEVAVRASVGATPRALFGQFLAESVTLALLGGLAGTALGWFGLRALVAAMPPYTLPPEADTRMSVPVLAFALGVSALAGVIFGCVPAWRASRVNLAEPLKEGGRSGAAAHHGLGRVLVIAEFALALTLLAGAGLLIHSVWNLSRSDLGVRTDHLLTFMLAMPNNRFSDPPQMVGFYRELMARLDALPGVLEAGASTGRPVIYTGFGMPFSIAGQPAGDPSARPTAVFQTVTPGYYKAFGIALDRGRSFTEQDVSGVQPVAMVNENFVRKFLPGSDPLGQRVVMGRLTPGETTLGPPVAWQIVGVFHNVRYGGVDNRDDVPEVDIPFWQTPWPRANIGVRTVRDPAALRRSVADAVHSLDPNLPLIELKTMDQLIDESMAADRVESLLFVSFALTALLLAGVGIYGVMAFSVAQRTQEIGIRVALGATPGQVLGLILREGLRLALAGVALGIVGAFLAQRIMQSQLYGIGSVDFVSFGIVAAVMIAAALLACYVPARRATRVSPIEALRQG